MSPTNTLPVSSNQWTWRELETRVDSTKYSPVYLSSALEFGDICTPQIGVNMGSFFQPILWVRTPCLDSFKGWCNIRIIQTTVFSKVFWNGLSIMFSSWVADLFVLWDSHFAVQNGYRNKTAAFLNVVPLELHCKIARSFVCGAIFENQMLCFPGDWWFDFQWWWKNR